MLQLLILKIELLPEVWHSIDEKADLSKSIVMYDPDGNYMSPPVRCPLSYDDFFVKTMNKKYGANYQMWAYMDDLAPSKEDRTEMRKEKFGIE